MFTRVQTSLSHPRAGGRRTDGRAAWDGTAFVKQSEAGEQQGRWGACETLYGTEGSPSWDQAAGAGRELTPDMEETQDKHSPHPPDCSTVQCISGKQRLEHLLGRLKCIMSIFDHTVSETIWSKQFMRSKLRKEGACFWSN